MAALPDARAVLPRGAPHLIDPTKLVAGSIQVYGDKFRELYGEILPLPADRVLTVQDKERIGWADARSSSSIRRVMRGITCAVDLDHRVIFSSDVRRLLSRFDTAAGPFVFPTTTPVQFDPAALHASIDRLLTYRPGALR
jgi:hypothetical protein